MNSGSNVVFAQNPNFISLGIASVNTTDKLGSISNPTTRFRRSTRSSDWIHHGHDIEEATEYRVSETIANIDYILKSDFETMREIQDFERENIYMSPLPLSRSTELLEHFTILTEQNGKFHEPTPEHFTILPEQNG